MSKYNPDLVFIRAKNKEGRWESLSVTEAPAGSVWAWWCKKLLDLDEGAIMTKEHRQNMLNVMEACGIGLVQLKPEAAKELEDE